jgi:DNA helicase IV
MTDEGPATARTAQLAGEQRYLEVLYARFDEVRERTRLRLAEVRRAGATGTPQARSERDSFAALHETRLAQLDAVDGSLCFGRLDRTDGSRHHIGRIGLTDESHDVLLVDWRAPAAEPFYRATAAEPMGVRRRRHLRTRGRRVLDLADDLFDVTGLTAEDRATLGGEAALIAALAEPRTAHMRDIVATIQGQQDRVIRLAPEGLLLVEGGPGTGKTAVALHRAAYLLYTHRDRLAKSGVLVVGPTPVFLEYIGQVLPSLGESGVVLATVDGLYPGLSGVVEERGDVAAVKADARMAGAVAAAIRHHQRVPEETLFVPFAEHDLPLAPKLVSRARSRARRSGHRHNRARYTFARALLGSLLEALHAVEPGLAGQPWPVRTLMANDEFREVVDRLWPRLTPEEVVRRLYSEPVLLAEATPWLSAQERSRLSRQPESPWTTADVAILDEARALLGSPTELLEVAAERRRRESEVRYAREVLQATGLSRRLRADDFADRFSAGPARSAAERAAADPDWTFGHVIVDEAQELSPMAWRMIARRCPTRSMTVVGDLAQSSAPWPVTGWAALLEPVAGDRWRTASLSVNYRTPREVMTVAARVLQAVDPGAAVPESVRDSGFPPYAVRVREPAALAETVGDIAATLRQETSGTVAVICAQTRVAAIRAVLEAAAADRSPPPQEAVRVLSFRQAKGLEFDAVVVVEPDDLVSAGAAGLRTLYVAITRTTGRLVVVHSARLPPALAGLAGDR